MYFTHHDASAGSLSFDRTFNTARLLNPRYGMFGPGWNSNFDKRLIVYGRIIERRDSTGSPTYYDDRDNDGTFDQARPRGKETWIVNTGPGFNLMRRAGGQEAYSTLGVLISETDAAGVTTSYTHDGSNRLTSVAREGRSITLTYIGASTKPATLQGPSGETLATFSYDASNRLIAVDYPDSAGYRYVYDANGRITFVDDADGRPSEAHEYDAQGRAITSETGDGRDKITLTYNTSTKTTVTDALGRQTIYEFQFTNLLNQITKVTGPCDGVCGAGAEVNQWAYDPNHGRMISTTDPAGKTWTYTYDPITQDLLTSKDPLNQTTTYTYDAQGRMLTRTDPDGAVTTYVQSNPGPTSITQSVTASTTRTTSIAYHANGRPQTITDPRGKVTTMAYDASTADLLTVTDALGHATTFTYDARGRRTGVADALNHSTTTTYDVRGHVTRITNHDGTHTDFGYDQAGRRSSVTDPLGRVTRYIYDNYGRPIAVVDPANQSTRYAYDLMGNLTSLTDAKNQSTSFEYDPHYRVKKTIYPGGAYETFTYDPRGRLATMADRKGIVTTYTYDDLGRLVGKSFANDPTNTPAFSYTYDAAGRMLTAVNGSDTLTWTYNLAGELLNEQSATNASNVAYTYDDGGNRLSVSLDGTLFVTYAYDDASRLTTITRAANGANPALNFGFSYDNANRRTGMSYPNGVNTVYQYDNLNRLTNLAATHTASGTSITNFGYQYDAAGNRTQKSTLDFTEDYKYDPLYRLTRADRTNPGALPPNQWTWGYDAVGNRLSAQKDAEATTSSYNEKNQLTQVSGGGKMLWRGVLDEPGNVNLTSAAASINGQPARILPGNVFEAELNLPVGQNTVTIQAQDGSGNVAVKNYSVTVTGGGATYTYDANGNLTQKVEGADTWVYTWNALDELTAVTKDGAPDATFGYDPLGRRVTKTHAGATARWLYDKEDIVRQWTLAADTVFVHGPKIDEPLAIEQTSASGYLHADGLGSVVRHTSPSGSIDRSLSYGAWGTIETGEPAPYGFGGREWDPQLNLWYLRARYYAPVIGRFVADDPIGFSGGLNLYAYVGQVPTTYVDPYGLKCCNDCPSGNWKVDGGPGFGGGVAFGAGVSIANFVCMSPDPYSPLMVRRGLQICSYIGFFGGLPSPSASYNTSDNPDITGVTCSDTLTTYYEEGKVTFWGPFSDSGTNKGGQPIPRGKISKKLKALTWGVARYKCATIPL